MRRYSIRFAFLLPVGEGYNENYKGNLLEESLQAWQFACVNSIMKTIWRFLIAILLGFLLVFGTWKVVHAPHYDQDAVPVMEQSFVATPMNTPRFTGNNQFLDRATAVPEKLPTTIHPTATPNTDVYSCANGPVGSGTFVWPTDNHSLSGNDYGAGHPGIDLAAGEGSPVYAADAGVVVAEGEDVGGYGNVIQIDHGNGYLTVYAHLSRIDVRICQGVEAGQQIGAAGSTGNANGAHLHFEVVKDERYINPWDVLP